jgi:endoglucanase
MKDLWIDIGAENKADCESVVRVGDPVTLELEVRQLRRDLCCSVAMDDKVGLWVVLEAFRRAAAAGPLPCGLFVASTVQEEIGLRGAQTSCHGVDPHVAIAVDVTHATDCPTIDKKSEGDVALGKGPVVFRGPNMNPHVVDRLLAASRAKEIPIQLAASGRATPTDANALQVTRSGVATGLVSVPNRYMHSAVETISLSDADRTADLIRLGHDIESGDSGSARGRGEEGREDPDHRGLASTIWSEQSDHLTPLDREIHTVERDNVAELLHHAFSEDRLLITHVGDLTEGPRLSRIRG